MDSRFIQLGNYIFAIDHIVALDLDAPGLFPGTRAVGLMLINDAEPFLFAHGTLEATALAEWSTAMMRTTRLVEPPSPPVPSSLSK